MEATWRWALVTAIAPIAWGSNYFVTRHLLPPDEPLWGAVLRALPAGLLLLAVTRELPRGSWLWRSVVLGTLNVGAFFVLIYLSSQLLPTSVASTVMASSAGVLLLIAWPLLGERPRLLPALGAALGLAGVATMLSSGLGGAPVDPRGVAVSLAAMTLSSFGFVLTRRWGGRVRVLSLTAWQLLAGALVVLPLAVVLSGPPPALDTDELIGFAYVSVVATAVAFAAWFAGLRRLPAASVGLIGLLNPVTGVLLGTVVAGEVFGAAQLVGTALVLGGVVLGQLSGRSASSTRRTSRSTSERRARTRGAAGPRSPASTPPPRTRTPRPRRDRAR
jgi:probable blue pigment (indigoidine) exporter